MHYHNVLSNESASLSKMPEAKIRKLMSEFLINALLAAADILGARCRYCVPVGQDQETADSVEIKPETRRRNNKISGDTFKTAGASYIAFNVKLVAGTDGRK